MKQSMYIVDANSYKICQRIEMIQYAVKNLKFNMGLGIITPANFKNVNEDLFFQKSDGGWIVITSIGHFAYASAPDMDHINHFGITRQDAMEMLKAMRAHLKGL